MQKENVQRRKRGFISTFFGNLDSLIPTFFVPFPKYRSIARKADAFFHALYWAGFPDCHRVELSVGNEEAKSDVFL